MIDDVRLLLQRDLNAMQREVALFPDDRLLWVTPEGVANSAGNLALHIAGNLRHFIGHAIGGVPYQRDREAEFARRSGSRDELISELRQAADVVGEVLGGLGADDLERPCQPRPDLQMPTRRFLLHLCTHTSFHLGQLGYLRRIVAGDRRSTDAVNVGGIGA